MSHDLEDRLRGLPVELRDSDFALVSRATVESVADKLAEASDATLYLSVTLPDGAKVGREVSCGDDGPKDLADVEQLLTELPTIAAFLEAQRSDEGPRVERVVRDGISYATEPGASERCFLGARVFRGSGATAGEPLSLSLDEPGRLSVTRAADSPPATLQLDVADWRPVNLILPAGAVVELASDGEGWFRTVLQTGMQSVDDLLRLRALGHVDDVASILKGFEPAEVADWYGTYPAAAAVLGYGFLRTHAPELLWEPFAAVARQRPDDPDALIIAGEIGARVGRHDDAVDAFLAAVRTGLPCFSFGLNYAVDRLRAYGPRPGGPSFSREITAAIGISLKIMHPFALYQDHETALTSYSGADPRVPEMDSGSPCPTSLA